MRRRNYKEQGKLLKAYCRMVRKFDAVIWNLYKHKWIFCYSAEYKITLAFVWSIYVSDVCVIFNPVSVTPEQQERSLAYDLMEISSLYGSHRAVLTEVSLYSCFHRLAESRSAFWNVIFIASVWFLWLSNCCPTQVQRILAAAILFSSCCVRGWSPLHKNSPWKQLVSATQLIISAILTIKQDIALCKIDTFDDI